MDIRVTPLGAGQDVGRSCLLLSIGGKNIMLDCGMHMGFSDDRRFPDFSYVTTDEPLTEHIDCVIISHFHLDHCGALPYMTEMVGYNGPIYMTVPTKAIAPILLEDMRKVAVDKKGEQNFFTSAMIKNLYKALPAGEEGGREINTKPSLYDSQQSLPASQPTLRHVPAPHISVRLPTNSIDVLYRVLCIVLYLFQ